MCIKMGIVDVEGSLRGAVGCSFFLPRLNNSMTRCQIESSVMRHAGHRSMPRRSQQNARQCAASNGGKTSPLASTCRRFAVRSASPTRDAYDYAALRLVLLLVIVPLSCSIASTIRSTSTSGRRYSARKATIGFTRVARRAGTRHESAAIAVSSAVTAM